MSDGTTVEDAIINNEGNVALVDTEETAPDSRLIKDIKDKTID
jgi:hypothetical protein